MQTVLAHPKDEAQITAVKAILEAPGVPYELAPKPIDNSPYNEELASRILAEKAAGVSKVISVEDLWK